MKASLPAVAYGDRAAEVISETIATGPVASWRLEPKIAASRGGQSEA